jgi:RecB family exonuclease
VITPRRTRLLRVPDLHAFRQAIVKLAVAGSQEDVGSRVVLVPSVDAARQLARTIGHRRAPALATREQFYDLLHSRMDAPPPRLSAYDRDVMIQSAASSSRLRPGLVAEVLRFYDQLRRQARTLVRFEELIVEALSEDAEHDRGAGRMLAQARWLAETLRGYESRVSEAGACDEHVLRDRLVSSLEFEAVRHIVVTIGDWIADPDGLYLADFDLLTRLPGVESIDVVTTGTLLESGFHERLHEWLPGIVEEDDDRRGSPRPALVVPAANPENGAFIYRDREEELTAVARRLTGETIGPATLERTAAVFKRPLPYLYLARDVFGRAGVPYQAFDALPLAAEPFAAALDAVFDFVESAFTRAALIALLRSPHFAFRDGERLLDIDAIDSLDRSLSLRRYLGTLDALVQFDSPDQLGDERAGPALRAAQAAAKALAPLLETRSASCQLHTLLEFLDGHGSAIAETGAAASRLRRQRAAVREALEALRAAHEAHGDRAMGVGELASSVRRWIEEQTFVPESFDHGVQLVDDQAARYGEFDDVTLLGVIEGEWPGRPARNVFFPTSLLVSLGWPTEQDRRAAAEARFVDLVRSAAERVAISTISLDDEALVEPSMLLEELSRAGLTRAPAVAETPADEATDTGVLDESAREWLALRRARSSLDAPIFHGQTDRVEGKQWSVSALETYLQCPFKFFAKNVLKLEEEPDDEEVMDPRRRGQFIHDVFEAFFDRWQRAGNQAVTPASIERARAMFHEVVEASLAESSLSETEAALERTRLLGSPAAAGLGEAVLRMEAERPVPVVARLLEHRLAGEFVFQLPDGPRRLPIHGKADRLDLLADGTFRLIDYKLGWPPNRARALQLPIYSLCAEQDLEGRLGRTWTLGEAAYLAFKGPRRVVSLFGSGDERVKVLADAQQRLAETVDAISAGEFPPSPDDVFRCETCSYSAVCRKEYVGDV